MLNYQKRRLGQITSIFALIIILLNPFVSKAFGDGFSETICTSSGIKVIDISYSEDEQKTNFNSQTMCEYCNLSSKDIDSSHTKFVVRFKNSFLNQYQLSNTTFYNKNLSLIFYHRQAPPTQI